MYAGHCDLCPSVVVAGKPPRSESNAAALIGPSRSTRGLVVVQSMIVEASPAEGPPSRTAIDLGAEGVGTPAAVVRRGLAVAVGAGGGQRPGAPEELPAAIGWSGTRTLRVSPSRGTAQRRARSVADDREGPGPVRGGQGPRRRVQVDVLLDVGGGCREDGQLEPVGAALDGVDRGSPRRRWPGRRPARRRCRWPSRSRRPPGSPAPRRRGSWQLDVEDAGAPCQVGHRRCDRARERARRQERRRRRRGAGPPRASGALR